MYQVPSATMMPTLRIGETILVDPSSYAKGAPRIGDIIAFHPPAGADSATLLCGNPHEGLYHRQACGVPMAAASSQTFIKRVVAGPGDRVTLKNGGVIRNGSVEAEPFRVACAAASICTFPQPVTIPANEYFVLGDNRAASADSRYWGPVKRSWIIGPMVREIR